jgi:hypothetical protein
MIEEREFNNSGQKHSQHSQYFFQQQQNNKKTIVYRYVTFLLHVSAYNGNLQGGTNSAMHVSQFT